MAHQLLRLSQVWALVDRVLLYYKVVELLEEQALLALYLRARVSAAFWTILSQTACVSLPRSSAEWMKRRKSWRRTPCSEMMMTKMKETMTIKCQVHIVK